MHNALKKVFEIRSPLPTTLAEMQTPIMTYLDPPIFVPLLHILVLQTPQPLHFRNIWTMHVINYCRNSEESGAGSRVSVLYSLQCLYGRISPLGGGGIQMSY